MMKMRQILLLLVQVMVFVTTSHGFAIRQQQQPQQREQQQQLSFLPFMNSIGAKTRINARTKTTQLCALFSSSDSSTLSPRQLIALGCELFRQGDVQGSIDKFNESVKDVPPGSRPYLWQRGISYYYVDDFAAGSQQFRDDVLRSPLDVEEIVWDIACLARLNPSTADFPPSNKLSLPPGKKDSRPIMAVVYSLFRGEATEHSLADAGHNGKPGDEFYSLFYLGLYNDARRDFGKAENYMRAAIRTRYATIVGSQDYMVDVAKVHCKVRGWVI